MQEGDYESGAEEHTMMLMTEDVGPLDTFEQPPASPSPSPSPTTHRALRHSNFSPTVQSRTDRRNSTLVPRASITHAQHPGALVGASGTNSSGANANRRLSSMRTGSLLGRMQFFRRASVLNSQGSQEPSLSIFASRKARGANSPGHQHPGLDESLYTSTYNDGERRPELDEGPEGPAMQLMQMDRITDPNGVIIGLSGGMMAGGGAGGAGGMYPMAYTGGTMAGYMAGGGAEGRYGTGDGTGTGGGSHGYHSAAAAAAASWAYQNSGPASGMGSGYGTGNASASENNNSSET